MLRHAVGPKILSSVTYVEPQYGQSICQEPSSFICLGGGAIPNSFSPCIPFAVMRSEVHGGELIKLTVVSSTPSNLFTAVMILPRIISKAGHPTNVGKISTFTLWLS